MSYSNEPIAIIGSGCRFPGEATSPSKLWDLLRNPRDVQRPIDRFRADNFYNEDGHYHGASNVLSSYLLSDDPRFFDAQFFNIPASEAEAIDPQQRILMETVYESLEAAGLSIESLAGSQTAVYVGVMCDDFSQIVYGDSENVPTYAATGSARSILSNRVSYFFNWHGPSMTIDTACSSSLVAVHQAVQTLRSGQSPVAIAAGTNLIFGPTMFIAESNLNMLSATGRSRMWDASADGYARGEGAGSVVMKTLSAALRDGDHIECIIRETGINQDGRTPGITMPSSTLQASLIRDTYARAGLDLAKRGDRCQYFEAHGTGTKAGDPQEAAAIHKAFFAHTDGDSGEIAADDGFEEEDVLYVGSIKTIVGHTEGTAGIAGLMKASLAIQNKIIPPNMHFTKLNPDIEPYYGNLKVPIEAREWPDLPPGVPRRASINSFGFGGANAHAIIESYETRPAEATIPSPTTVPYLFVFSGASEKSLIASLRLYLTFFRDHPDYSLDKLSWSLFRRTALKFRIAFSAFSIDSLAAQIEMTLADSETKKEHVGVRVNPRCTREILVIFTGQGAQWATVGRELILTSHLAESIIDDLENSLARLPDGPEWSLKEEMLASKDRSQIALAAISQPVCTAVQIMVVDILRQSGIHFSAVVGHSSGEIACAYAAGFLSAQDAIRIAYYRGKYASLAKNSKGQRGAMIAAGTNIQDAKDLCNLPKLRGKAQLAASNSSASVTISGDADAIDLVEMVFQDESRFARKLKVDTAYHCFHMIPCSEPYVSSLKQCGIHILEPADDACPWYSSVLGGERVTIGMKSVLESTYWRDNMLKPVLFSQALESALAATGAPGLVLEVGPHPALKGPASLTIEELLGSSIPYFGTLARGKNDNIAMTDTLGSIWSILGPSSINLQAFQRAFAEDAIFEISKNLPTYTWDHDKLLWNESRISKAYRLRAHAMHELLGTRTTDEVEGELRWRNYLKPQELPWLHGHQIQGQMVFPAAGFAVMALEAARNLAPFDEIRLMEIRDFSIHRALPFMDENAAVETIFVMANIRRESTGAQGYITADFVCHACLNKDGGFTSMANGQVHLTVGEQSDEALPERPEWVSNFINTDVEYFYEALATLGYGYTDMFKGVVDLQRTNGGSRGLISIPSSDELSSPSWIIHPATLDVAFQSVFAAVGAPGDGRLWALHIPTMIRSIVINPGVCEVSTGIDIPLPFDACISKDANNGITGDVDLYSEDGKNAIVQIQGLHVTPLSKPTEADDRETFAAITWNIADPDLVTNWDGYSISVDDEKLANFIERLSFYIVRDVYNTVDPQAINNCSDHQRAIFKWSENVVKLVESGKHATCSKQWLADTWEILGPPAEHLAKVKTQVQLCLWIKERLAAFVRGELSIKEEPGSSWFLGDFYSTLSGYEVYRERLGTLIRQIAFRHRNLKILEIGSGGRSCAKMTIDAIGDNFMSYTYANVESTDFEDIRSKFPDDHSRKMFFKNLDIEYDPTEQGFTAGYYDLVISSNTIHATACLEEALKNTRTLLRPGGYLALLEITDHRSLSIGLLGCIRPGWFAATENSRRNSEFIPQKAWDDILRDTGFSGIDTATPEIKSSVAPFSVMCSMAVNREMEIIRDPLAYSGEQKFNDKLLIIGGQTIQTSRLVRGLKDILKPFFNDIIHFDTVVEVDNKTIAAQPTIVNLMELDEPFFNPFTREKFEAVVKLCDNSHTMLWVTIGSRGENPYMNMMIAVGRCLVGEMPSLRLQALNFDGNDRPTPITVAHHLLRLRLTYHFSTESIKINDPLYTNERELSIQNNVLLIPRYLPVPDINARVNSERRLITHDLDQSKVVVGIERGPQSYKLRECSKLIATDDNVKIVISKCILNPIRAGVAGCLYVTIGSTADTGKKVIALSGVNQSMVSVPRSWTIEVDVIEEKESGLLLHIAAQLLAATIIGASPGVILVHEPSALLAQSIKNAAERGGKVVAMTSVSSTARGIKHIHHLTPDRMLAKTIPQDVTSFFDLSETTEAKTVACKLEKYLAPGCDTRTTSFLYSPKAFATGADASTSLAVAVKYGLLDLEWSEESATVIPASTISSTSVCSTGLQIVDWKADPTVPAAITPADQSIRFRGDRTYFMVGLTGELGLQLTKWMVQRGARYLALSSRNPQIDASWLKYVRSQGATVKVYPMDITDRISVRAVHRQISQELPPVAGVANGAMILIDGLFANKSHAEFDKTLRPKVDGTVFLDELFNHTNLEFFIVFSSLAYVSGNMGQTAYAAANAFMCSLVAGRRMRGLCGSAINMPGIVGLGYLNRDPRKLDRLKNVGYVNISEWEFYQFFSEAIMAGHPNSGMNPEITAGLQRLNMEHNPNPPIWAHTPRFGWLQMVKPSGESSSEGPVDGSSIRGRLAELSDENDIHQLLLDGLLSTLYARLNMNPDDRGITADTAIVELGVDSLLAVDMRSWFTKELDLDMPVLKILGGATVNELVEDAMKRLSPELIPNILRGGDVSSQTVPDDKQELSNEARSFTAAGDVPNVEIEAATPTSRDQNLSIDTEQLGKEEVDEVITIAPIDLPSINELVGSIQAPEGVKRDAKAQTHTILSQKVSRIPDSPLRTTFLSKQLQYAATQSASTESLHSDTSGACPGTPTTLVSEIDIEETKDQFQDVDEELVLQETPTAKLFSWLPDYMNAEQVYIKKERMSYGTSRFWFLMQYLEDPTTFNLMCRFKITGPVRLDDAYRSVIELGNRHEVFRTCFFADPERMNEPTMGVLEQSPLRLERRTAASEADVEAEMDEILSYEFKIEQGETIRIKMISLDDITHHVIFGFHHIAMDGFSFNMLIPEINKLYDAEPMESITTQFSDFAARQRLDVANGSFDEDFQFWKEMYSIKLPSGEVKPDFPDAIPLFSIAKNPRKSLDNYEFEESKLILDPRIVRRIKAQCRRHKITTFHFFLGVLRTFLFRHIDVDDLVIGIADANRADKALDKTVGFMLNLLPLRFRSEGQNKNIPFRDIALDARTKAYDALAHSRIPFDALLERLNIPRSASSSPLFQVWMDYRPFTMDTKPKMFGGEVTGSQSVGRNGYDLTLDVNEVTGSDIRVSFRTQKYLYSAEATQLLFDSYIRLVNAFATSFDTKIESVPLWDPKDIESAKMLGRGPRLVSTWPETLSHRIYDISVQNPDKEALNDCRGNSLTYRRMQNRVQSISEALSRAGVRYGSRIAVFQHPGIDWVCSLLAIWHAGCTYIPMDLRNSLHRLAVIAKTAKPAAILYHAETKGQLVALGVSTIPIDISSIAEVTAITKSLAKPDVPAAILFTSGSTGTPKGVMLKHSAFKNTIEGLTSQYHVGPERILQQSAYTFDFSLEQITCGLVNAGSVVIVPQEIRGDPVAISKIIEIENITYTRATPSEYASWITYGASHLMRASNWRFAWGGGETMPQSLKQSIESLGLENLKLYNSYGPAESITCTKTEVPYGPAFDEDEIPAGFPLPNYSVYIVDRSLEPVPQGVVGEIVIGGPSVASGYLNNIKLSDSKFIGNQYSPPDFASLDGHLVYRTGDMGRLRTDGALLFQGRMAGDTQIKLRGIRIELGDIESTIVQSSEGALYGAVVTMRGEMLVAHVQFSPGQYMDRSEQNAFLRSLRFVLPLPTYMVPSVFIPMDRIPVNAHGKIDRAAVQALEIRQENPGRSSEDLTETERRLAEVWKEVILNEGVSTVTELRDSTTFFEIGGNSLLLVKLQIMVNMQFNTKLSLGDLFSAVTLGSMAAKINAAEQADQIDWESEVVLDQDIPKATNVVNHPKKKPQTRKVLVTGSTGFLGRKLLQTLVDSSGVEEVHCVAVRPKQRSKQVVSKKIKIYSGDLAAPRLGLSEDDFKSLSTNIDLIVHVGVSRSFLDSYQLLRGPNFESTKTLVKLAAPRRIPFHYFSSGGVLNMTDHVPPMNYSEGYTSSKWASERYLANASTQCGLPVAIHRIMRASSPAVPEVTEKLVQHLRDIASDMGAAPTFGGWEASFDIIHIDNLAQSVMEALDSDLSDNNEVAYFQYQSEATLNMNDALLNIVSEKLNLEAAAIPAVQWLARARNRGLRWQVTSMDNAPLSIE
ncbi:hypothetical protein F4809DRAFT_656376 [Biscogniauxia mediterranea]|nr:hypothetical protein F4809DRAFT_656376 [Biscogniauxia mediterranea]